ncbi:MAG: sugar ABC transporter permease [Pseudonocardiales bacterium]|nr:MAG: sugar ABC transporter permease [Pseudonocardiales bacterium]
MATAATEGVIAPSATRPARARPWLTRERMAGFLFVTPSLIQFLIFTVYLMVSSLVISTWSWDLLTPHRQRGFYNYTTLLLHDPIFRTAFKNTLELTLLTVAPGMILGLLLAMVVNTRLRGISIFRAAYFLPVVVPTVATAIIFRWLYNPDFGVLNWFLGLFGLQHHDWLGSPSTALASIAAMSVWQSLGWNMTYFLVGLQSIPEQLYEAARIDGAGAWMRFRSITWPLLTPMTFFVLVTSMIGSLQGGFDSVYLMTQGGPGYSTYTNSFYLYSQAFRYFHYGYAAAYAWVLFVVIGIVTFLQFRFLSKRINYDFG